MHAYTCFHEPLTAGNTEDLYSDLWKRGLLDLKFCTAWTSDAPGNNSRKGRVDSTWGEQRVY